MMQFHQDINCGLRPESTNTLTVVYIDNHKSDHCISNGPYFLFLQSLLHRFVWDETQTIKLLLISTLLKLD